MVKSARGHATAKGRFLAESGGRDGHDRAPPSAAPPGVQHHDGSVTREIVVHQLHADYLMTVKQAWQLAELVAEAETIDGYDRITVS
jgi:hypothetical protein